MTGDRDALLGQAERLIKRGELREAEEILQALAHSNPADERIRARWAAVRALAEPGGVGPAAALARAAVPVPAPAPAPRKETPEEIAEARVALGDLATAVAIYERIAAKLPNHPTARRRLEELRARLAPPPAPRAPEPRPLPADPVEALQELLGRVQANRRG